MTFIERLAQEHDIEVRFRSDIDNEAYVIGRTIVLDPTVYEPRLNWRFCHELAHLMLGHTSTSPITREMEHEANELAAELMLPRREFQRAMSEYDLPALKEMFPHASWEAIARRWSELRPAVLTIFDNGAQTSRSAPAGFNYPLSPVALELEACRRCYQARSGYEIEQDGVRVRGIFVDENRGVERVLELTELL